MFMELARKKGRGRPRKNVNFDGCGIKDVGSDIKQGVRKVGAKTKKGFNKTIVDSGIGKEIAKELIDVGADVLLPSATTGLSMMLGDPTGVSGAVVGKVLGDQIQREAEKGGYGLKDYGFKGKKLKAQKDKMTELFSGMGLNVKHAKALTNKVFKHGSGVLDMPEVKITGGKLTLSKIKKSVLSEGKKIWNEARPVLKFAGETALNMAEPLVEAGIKQAAISYGMEPEQADVTAKIFTATGRSYAEKGLNRLSKKQSKNPQEYVDRASAIVQDRSAKLIDRAEKEGLSSISKSAMSDEAKQLAMDKLMEKSQGARNVVDLNVEKVESQIQQALSSGRRRRASMQSEQDSTGGMGLYSRNDMSTLLSPDSVAKQSFYVRPNIQQGQITGISGGSLYADTMQGSGLGRAFKDVYGFGVQGSSFRNVSGRGNCMCGGSFR
jgi:hypothetical protein